MKNRGWVIAAVLGVVFVVGGFLAVWQFLAPTDRRVAVPYSEFIEEVHAGHVREIKVHGRDIDYRVASSGHTSVMRHAVGPFPDQAFLDTLKPTSSNDQPPRIIFEK